MQFRLTWSVIFTQSELTAKVPNGSQVQLPVGQLTGGTGSEIRFEDNSPLYVATFIS